MDQKLHHLHQFCVASHLTSLRLASGGGGGDGGGGGVRHALCNYFEV